mmetsp:Transcript_16967/g.59338  ORF Transcript_16967/g.59338 Transcript_16967/m.59338 type:complete len:212 (+) Transcript_16967:305-940(+)
MASSMGSLRKPNELKDQAMDGKSIAADSSSKSAANSTTRAFNSFKKPTSTRFDADKPQQRLASPWHVNSGSLLRACRSVAFIRASVSSPCKSSVPQAHTIFAKSRGVNNFMPRSSLCNTTGNASRNPGTSDFNTAALHRTVASPCGSTSYVSAFSSSMSTSTGTASTKPGTSRFNDATDQINIAIWEPLKSSALSTITSARLAKVGSKSFD